MCCGCGLGRFLLFGGIVGLIFKIEINYEVYVVVIVYFVVLELFWRKSFGNI